jgi:hypothetical protein
MDDIPEKKRRGRPPKVKAVGLSNVTFEPENEDPFKRPVNPPVPIQNSTVNASAAVTQIAVVAPTQLEVGKVYKFMGEDIATDVTGKAILMSIVPFEVMKITASKIAVKFAFGSIEVHSMLADGVFLNGLGHVSPSAFAEYPNGLFQ